MLDVLRVVIGLLLSLNPFSFFLFAGMGLELFQLSLVILSLIC